MDFSNKTFVKTFNSCLKDIKDETIASYDLQQVNVFMELLDSWRSDLLAAWSPDLTDSFCLLLVTFANLRAKLLNLKSVLIKTLDKK